MENNRIKISLPIIKNNSILFNYEIFGPWKEAFCEHELFQLEYSLTISSIPAGIALIPLLANLLPIAWIYNAEIIVPTCDKDFFNSIEYFKRGYINMYPMIHFGGKLTIDALQENIPEEQSGSVAFFSGGVDAFQTLISHIQERPTLLTLWGSDITFEDIQGWQHVKTHLEQTAKEFRTDFVTVRSSFRRFLHDDILDKQVKKSGDGWWHGFQHGIGIISHAAPIVYVLGKKNVYFASSFTAAEKGKVTCASDPTIDEQLQFCGAHVTHDGYAFTRQMKIHHLGQFSSQTGQNISLRVCWESDGGTNCCNCEKCWRTILGIFAEGYNPQEFGFDYDKNQLKKLSMKMRYEESSLFRPLTYKIIQKTMQKNFKKTALPEEIRWFYNTNVNLLGKAPLNIRIVRKLKRVIKNFIAKEKKYVEK